jgi:hypothetical protein
MLGLMRQQLDQSVIKFVGLVAMLAISRHKQVRGHMLENADGCFND